MLHTILRNTSFSLFLIGMLFWGILSIATAETGSVSTETRVQTTTVSSDTRASTTPMTARRKAFDARAAEFRTNAKARTEALETNMKERRARISEKVETRVRTVIGNLRSRGAATIERLTAIADRIEARARQVASERGVNVAASLALIAEARVELRAARVILDEHLSAETDVAVTTEEPKAAFEYVKDSMREVHGHIMAARKALHEAVAALKVVVKVETKTEQRATTTTR